MDYQYVLIWAAIVGAGALTVLAARRLRQMKAVPAELRSAALMVSPTLSPMLVRLIRLAAKLGPAPKSPRGVRMSERLVAASADRLPVRIVVFERETSSAKRPALLWIHGGGYVIGTPEQNMAFFENVLNRLDIAIVSVDYRLAPEHPFPAPLDDCHAALRWIVEHSSELAIDIDRIVIGGQSAGGGLAAALVQRVVDEGLIAPVFQLFVYPMLDARTTATPYQGPVGQFVWTPKSNRFGWTSYLGRDPAIGEYPAYAVPAQRSELAGLPPAWIGVGTLDLFHDEDVEYGKRLREVGVACVTYVVEGGYHAFDVRNPKAAATSHFYDSMLAALSRNLGVT